MGKTLMEWVTLKIDERARLTVPPKARKVLGKSVLFGFDEKTGTAQLSKKRSLMDLYGIFKDDPLGTDDLRDRSDDSHRYGPGGL